MLKYYTPLFVTYIIISLMVNEVYGQFGNKVVDTPHNLLKATQGSMEYLEISDYGDVCVYCHIQHSQNLTPQTPLWNRNITTITYQLYKGQTRNTAAIGTMDSTSLGCLSCHDDSSPLDAVKQAPPTHTGEKASLVTIDVCSNTCHTISNPSGDITFEGGNMGSDLRDHHPVGMTYDILRNTNLRPPSGAIVNGLPLYGSNLTQVGCASCHDPHDNTFRPFLRISNNNGELCQACHNI